MLNFLLNEFFAHIEEDRLSMEQEMRAGSIAWISTFAPEVVGGKERIRIREIRNFMHEKEDYRTSYWYKSLWFDAACFLLDGDQYDIAMIIANINHGNSSLRSAVHPPLGLISTKVELEYQDITQRMESCIEHNCFYNESLMCILWALKGNIDSKIELVKGWLNRIDNNRQSAKLLKGMIDGKVISNSLISDEFSLMQRYLFCRLLDPELDKDFDEDAIDSLIMDAHLIWSRAENHPLLGTEIFFRQGKLKNSQVK